MDKLDYHQVSHSSPAGIDNVGGVNVYPTPITAGEDINIIYEGLLSNSGADQVFMHMGYGAHNKWNKVQDLKMFHTGRGWEQTLSIDETSRLNFCFKDSANNWDNNSGHNWSFEIHDGKM